MNRIGLSIIYNRLAVGRFLSLHSLIDHHVHDHDGNFIHSAQLPAPLNKMRTRAMPFVIGCDCDLYISIDRRLARYAFDVHAI